MTLKILQVFNISIIYLYFAIATITPLIFTTQTTELYEVPKMFFVYFGTALIFFFTIIKFLLQKQIAIPKNPIVLAFAIFVLVNLISTFFSIDKFTSIFGYPTRLNGGLASQIAYFVLLAAAFVNINTQYSQKLLIVISTAALSVALLGIPGHFDRDPSCLILTGELTSSCWQEGFEPTQRIFSTLGQPNWLASFLVLSIPLTLFLGLTLGKKVPRIFFLASSIIQFWALIFTASRAGFLGILSSLAVLLLLLGKDNLLKFKKVLITCAFVFLSLYLVFGTNLTARSLEPISSLQNQEKDHQSQDLRQPSQTPSLPTESVQIRLIVWRGALSIFKHSPILGTGPETFASSYFMFRPLEHNKTTEWDFFYNKAHNEFLNYLATTGALGFISFIAFLLITFHQLLKADKKDSPIMNARILNAAAAASITGYLVTIFFGFSTVATQTTFFLMIPAIVISSRKNSLVIIDLKILKEKYQFPLLLSVLVIGLFTLSLILKLFLSDIFEKRAQDLKDEDPQSALVAYQNAVNTHPAINPYLLSDFSYTLATYIDGLKEEDASQFSKRAQLLAQKADNISPNNYLIAQQIAKTNILLTQYSAKYQAETWDFAKKLTALAPTYPPAYLLAAKTQIVLEDKESALKSLELALRLKPDYLEAQQLYEQLK